MILARAICGLISLIFFAFSILSVRESLMSGRVGGMVGHRVYEVDRRRQPFSFWTSVVVYVLAGLFFAIPFGLFAIGQFDLIVRLITK